MTSTPSCCSTPAVVGADYTPLGQYTTRIGDLGCYETGPADSKNVIVCLYDIFGYASQTKQGADLLAAESCYRVIMPDVFRGKGFDVKRIPKDGFASMAPEEVAEMKKGFAAFQTPEFKAQVVGSLRDIAKELRSQGATKLGLYGLCWGGKVVSMLLSENIYDAIGQAHPSQLDANDSKDIVVPFASFISKDESAEEQDKLEKLVKSKSVGPLSIFARYPDVGHAEISSILTKYTPVTPFAIHKRDSSSTSSLEINLILTDGEILTVDVVPNIELVQNLIFANPHPTNAPVDTASILKGTVRDQPLSIVRLAAIKAGLYEGHARYQKEDGTWITIHFEVVPSETDPKEYDMISYLDEDVVDHFEGVTTCSSLEGPVLSGAIPEMDKSFFTASVGIAVDSSLDDLTESMEELGDCTEDADGRKVCPVRTRGVPLTARTASITGIGKDCPIAVVADYEFSDTFGDSTEAVVLSLFNDIDSIYEQTLNVRTPLSYLYVVRNVSDPSGFGQPAGSATGLLNQLVAAVQNGLIPKLPASTCLVHVLTVQDFNPTLGLAYVGKSGALGGICSGGGYNTGISTPLYSDTLLARATYVTTVTHELGHGMGSNHDTAHGTPPGNPASCNPAQSYIMYPSASTSTNMRLFSTCSQYEIDAALNSVATCFVQRNALAGLQANESTELWYTDTIKTEDECALRTELTGAPAGGYADCPSTLPANYICNLVCINPQSTSSTCVVFPDAHGHLQNKTDGTLCGGFNSQTQVCLSGTCQLDTRVGVCDRRTACCDAYGVKLAAGTSCALTSAGCPAGGNSTLCGTCTASGECVSDKATTVTPAATNVAEKNGNNNTITIVSSTTVSSKTIHTVAIGGGLVAAGGVIGAAFFFLYKRRSASAGLAKVGSASLETSLNAVDVVDAV
ncbi:hypothetical protein HKX48_007448 [Thoreauomyces humboldtii]|nr:hypothetical protein HKX48_007448 [Thoreauomyces humboldtii]